MGPLLININVSGRERASGELTDANMYIHPFDITKTLKTVA